MSVPDRPGALDSVEQRYRRVLRLLPASYRQAWEEDRVATFLASVASVAGAAGVPPGDTDHAARRARLSWSEVASVAALALRLHLCGPETPPLSVRGETVRAIRLVALVTLLVSAVGATWGLWRTVWLANEIPFFPAPAQVPSQSVDWANAVWSVIEMLGVAAFLALVFGRWWAARLLAVLGFVPFVGFAVRDTLAGHPVFARWTDVLVSALLLLTLAAFHRSTAPVRPRPWLIAFAVGGALTPLVELAIWALPPDSQWLLGWPPLHGVLIVAAALVYLGGQALGRSPAPAWALALALLASAMVLVQAVTLWEIATFHSANAMAMTLGVLHTGEVLLAGLLLIAFAAHDLRQLPPHPAPAVLATPPAQAES